MSALGDPTNIKVERMKVRWASQEITKVCAVADASDSLNGKYFTIDAVGTPYYVWINTNSGVDPAPAGKTEIEIAASTDDSAAAIAALMQTAIDALGDFHCEVDPCDSDCIVIMNAAEGSVTDAVDVDSTFTVTVQLQGASLDLGFTDSLSVPIGGDELLDVTAQQLGTNIIQRLRTGRNLEAISIPMKESDAVKLREIMLATGESVTPAGGTAVIGIGTSKDGQGVLSDSRKLVMHPVRLADSDRSEDFCWWRAYPVIASIDLAGDSEELINTEFSLLPDPVLQEEVKHLVFGDHLQNFLDS